MIRLESSRVVPRLPFAALLLLVAAFGPPARAAAAEYLISVAEGPLTIGTDGRVQRVDLRSSLVLSDEQALEAMVKRWAFAPVVENGRAVEVDARVELELVAVLGEDDSARIGVQGASFFEGRQAPSPRDMGLQLARPEWPKDALRSGALVVLWLGLDGDATPRDIRVVGGWMTGQAAKPSGARGLKARRGLIDATRTIAGYWDFSPVTRGDCAIRVPVRFWLPVDGWQPAAPVVVEAVPEGVAACDLTIGRSGEVASRRIELLTPLRRPMPTLAPGA